jgi:type I restriction enzyme, S subunit
MKLLKDYVEIILGGTPSTNRTDFWDGEIPWVSIVDFNNNRKIYETEKTITEAGLRQSNTKLLNEGDIVISARGTVGKVVVCGKKMAFNQSCYALKTKDENNLIQNFLFYLIQEKIKYLKQMAVGGVFNTIIKSTLEKIPIELPTVNIQSKISEILLRYDYLIDINLRRIKLLEEAARLLYHQWFVYFRFPGHQQVKFIDGIPEGWKKIEFSELVDFKEGPGLRNYQFKEQGIPFLNIRTFGDDEIDLNKVGYLDENEVYSKYKHFLLKEDDHVVSSSGTLGRLVTIRSSHLPLMLNTSLIRMRPKKPMKKWTLKAYLLYDDFIKKVTSLATGAAQLNFGPSHLHKTTIFFPRNDKIIDKFEENVSTIYLKKKNLLEQNQKLSQARDLLLPRLMSGKIDFSEFDEENMAVESEVEKIVN